jgi:hypothetical protein
MPRSIRGMRNTRTERGLLLFGGMLGLLTACRRTAPAIAEEHDAAPSTPASASLGLPTRYEGRPMLIVVEFYALSVIGALPPDKEDGVRAIVQRTFGGDSDWHATVRRTMGWPPNVDEEVLSKWRTFTQKAHEQGIEPDPTVFARAFGDESSKD